MPRKESERPRSEDQEAVARLETLIGANAGLDPLRDLIPGDTANLGPQVAITEGSFAHDKLAIALVGRIFTDIGALFSDAGVLLQQAGGEVLAEKSPKEKYEDAKKKMTEELDKLAGEVDKNSDMKDEDKKKAKAAIDDAKKKVKTCKDEDLQRATDALNKYGDGLPKDIRNHFRVTGTFGYLIRIKHNWQLLFGTMGVKDVKVEPKTDGEGKTTECIIHVTGTRPSTADELEKTKKLTQDFDEPVKVKPEKCKETGDFIEELKKKVEKCDYPTYDDAEKLWGLIDP
ncbi:MAG: hypothetical protein ACLQOO_03455 [Terriglobia bacterium]